MALRKKKQSRAIETAEFRLNALRNIDESIDFGAGFTVNSFQELVEKAKAELYRYNAMMADVDQQRALVRKLERELNDANERIFTGIITRYGRDSIEYEMIGGVRKSNIYNKISPVTHEPEAPANGDESGEGEI